MEASMIHHQLTLAVRLLDTTTGYAVQERNVAFVCDGRESALIPRGNGTYLLVNEERRDFTLLVKVYGYEPRSVAVCYKELDEKIPTKEVFLIPSENHFTGEPILSLKGNLPGIEAMDAVLLGQSYCCVREYEERKRTMMLMMKSRLAMEDIYYGVLHMEKERKSYEPFAVEKSLSPVSIKLREPLKEPFSANSPITRIIFGQTRPDGTYLLRVRDNADSLEGIVRYIVMGVTKYQTVDFHNLTDVRLE